MFLFVIWHVSLHIPVMYYFLVVVRIALNTKEDTSCSVKNEENH